MFVFGGRAFIAKFPWCPETGGSRDIFASVRFGFELFVSRDSASQQTASGPLFGYVSPCWKSYVDRTRGNRPTGKLEGRAEGTTEERQEKRIEAREERGIRAPTSVFFGPFFPPV